MASWGNTDISDIGEQGGILAHCWGQEKRKNIIKWEILLRSAQEA